MSRGDPRLDLDADRGHSIPIVSPPPSHAALASSGAAPSPPAYRALVLVAMVALALAAYTSHKLLVMARLRGDVGEVPVRDLVVESAGQRLSDDVVEYRLSDPQQPTAGAWTIQLTADQAARHPRHATVAVRCDGRECYLPDSVYISDGNLAFDATLLGVELVAVLGCALVLVLRWRAWRAARRGAHLPTAHLARR